MAPREIINELEQGKTVQIRTGDAMEFMRRVERFRLTSIAIKVSVNGPRTTLQLDGPTAHEEQS